MFLNQPSFTTLEFSLNATYKAQTCSSKASIEALMDRCDLNVRFIPDLLGRPNDWSPEIYSASPTEVVPGAVGRSCHPCIQSTLTLLHRLLLSIS